MLIPTKLSRGNRASLTRTVSIFPLAVRQTDKTTATLTRPSSSVVPWRIDLFLVAGDMEQCLINVFFGLGPGRIKILGLGDADGNGIHTVVP